MLIQVITITIVFVIGVLGTLTLRLINRKFPSVTPYQTQEEKRQEIKEYGYDPFESRNDDTELNYVDFLEDRILERLDEKPTAEKNPSVIKIKGVTIGENISNAIDPFFANCDKSNFIKEQKEAFSFNDFGQTKVSQKQD